MKTHIPLKLRSMLTWTSLFAIVFFMSCTQDTGTDPLQGGENLNATTAKSAKGKKVAKSIYGRLSNFADPNEPLEEVLQCNPEVGFSLTRNIISGNMRHLGKLQSGISDPDTGEMISGCFGVPVSCDINLETFAQLITVYEVTYVAANGDAFFTTEQVTINFPNFVEGEIDYTTGNFVGTAGFEHAIEITGGTGRFEGASGHMDFMNAQFGPEGSTWELVGEIIY
ncbi:hypothetical protein SAMN06265375_101467 [Muriicola jejuensis]|uniref:Uncharacterized protein n=1 Tax=Muriicola jejuensis TaxID=504488 RepID=A0A6P0U9W9_9FLAO|nr:hypothetical protein [Muriicola jejuensis]NER10005.1 hypothetical protein [Muriicola jejuensis]SMP03867.1 hypothetical protein SAMN06265375_101467 [Muriicola jejuensis]